MINKCDVCFEPTEKLLEIVVYSSSEGEPIRKAELVPMCMECFLRYAGVKFKLEDIPERWY